MYSIGKMCWPGLGVLNSIPEMWYCTIVLYSMFGTVERIQCQKGTEM